MHVWKIAYNRKTLKTVPLERPFTKAQYIYQALRPSKPLKYWHVTSAYTHFVSKNIQTRCLTTVGKVNGKRVLPFFLKNFSFGADLHRKSSFV